MEFLKKLQSLDFFWITEITKSQNKFLSYFFRLLSLMGEGKVWLLFLFFLSYYVRSTGREIDFLNATAPAGVAWILSSSLKRLFKRPRPYQALNLPRPKAKYWNDSMPSSHAATTFAFAVTLLLMGHVLALPFVVWATLVSFSRLYLGLHFMSDVFFGALLGTGVAFGIYNYIF